MNYLLDKHNRRIEYLRLALTDKCNLRCFYCYPKHYKLDRSNKELSFAEISSILESASTLGIRKVRFTGGEPLLRNDVLDIIGKASSMKKFKEICLTTNGTRLSGLAGSLKEKGLSRINISIDSLDPDIYCEITGKNVLDKVLKGVKAAKEAGLKIKINFVHLPKVNNKERRKVIDYCKKNNFDFQAIKRMDLNSGRGSVRPKGYQRPPNCLTCNKIRINSRGLLFSCLFTEAVGRISDFKNIKEAIMKTVEEKPKTTNFKCATRHMISIGG